MPHSSTDVPAARVPAAASPGQAATPGPTAESSPVTAPGPVTPSDLDACLRVLAAAGRGELDGTAALAVERAVTAAHRGGKKRRKADRAATREQLDRQLLATASRFREEIPHAAAGHRPLPHGDRSTQAAVAAGEQGRPARPLLHRPRRCYVCKEQFRQVDADYHQLCPPCAEHNRARRDARCDLTGRRAVVTGGRVKIGFHIALKLLRDGADVLVTTRFPRDAARRFGALPDAAAWSHRLHVHGADFLDLAGVLGLVDAVGQRWDHLDILVNNAAQTLHRPAAYHREVRAAELLPLTGPAAAIATTAARHRPDTAVVLPDLAQALFPAGHTDETGQPLDLREVNSWTLHAQDVSPREWLEVHVVNAFAPFLLTSRLRPLLAAAPHPVRHVVQVSAMEGSFSRDNKTQRHPHTNMAKAALNMLTRTLADDYHGDGILMNSVDTGWVTDERPHPDKQAQREAGFRPPLDVIDGAARVYDPIVRAEAGDPVHGAFLKDYRQVAW
ncbi:SDR family NAD(P)-dependent oxidoreductase [Catellatospora chokoriensis]|uniref:Oxidoreductase n=1 Tax=Catellatospora chokoriensis TaxID=310353 RepID=A0A8J3NUW3_9ACTN|nr:SDR family oxidoreductase [Catellatospora chokoriensis]GIF93311.1 oxidoreductase [Catellatospora chokoriensis]